MSDQIAEIRARHETDDRWRLTTSMICPGAHDDRAALLAEVERLARERDEARREGFAEGWAAAQKGRGRGRAAGAAHRGTAREDRR